MGHLPAPLPEDLAGTTTHWSKVLKAGDTRDPGCADALAWLCRRYWYPVYAQVRRTGRRAEDTRDLVQGFFVHLLEKRTLKMARPERGRFRAFLKTSLLHYLANERDREHAKKRGGGHSPIPLDVDNAEMRYRREPCHTVTPETIFERRWACSVLENVLEQLRSETAAEDRERFVRIESILTGEGDGRPYRQMADELGTTEAAVKMSVHRARKRFGKLLRAEIARTIDDPSEVDDEIRFLFAALEQ